MQFDPKSAAPLYAQTDTDDLIQIAFLDQDCVEEAKELAKAELANRGFTATAKDIARAHLRMEEKKRETQEATLRSFESDDEMPGWRQKVRASLAPYRRALAGTILVLLALAGLNALLGWGFLNLDARKSVGVALLVGLLFHIFVVPSREDWARQLNGKKNRS
jgi:hypothetical protein